jgi:serine/threonine protein kinase
MAEGTLAEFLQRNPTEHRTSYVGGKHIGQGKHYLNNALPADSGDGSRPRFHALFGCHPWRHQSGEICLFQQLVCRILIRRGCRQVNVLVDFNRNARLADFGLASTFNQATMAATNLAGGGAKGTVRWIAPELLDADNPRNDESDVYALAMTIVEVRGRNAEAGYRLVSLCYRCSPARYLSSRSESTSLCFKRS